MDSRSKYANLPFVAVGEKDVFETEDTPESTQPPTRESQLWDVSIDVISCGTLEAFQRFADCKHEEFSDEKSSESMIDKYNRLRDETQELVDSAAKDTDQSNKDLVSKIDSLSKQLQELQNLRFDSTSSLKNVFENIENPFDIQKKSGTDSVDGNESEIKYKLWYKPEHSRLHDLTKINSLEQRIKRIETALGGNENKMSVMTNYYKDKSIADSVHELSAKVAQFDQSSLERVDSRLHMITDKLSQIADRKAQFEDLEKTSKLSELYDLITKNEKSRATLPHVLERLETLNELQEQAMQFSSGLSYLDSLQTQVMNSLRDNNKQLESMNESFIRNTDAIKEVCLGFDKRLEALK